MPYHHWKVRQQKTTRIEFLFKRSGWTLSQEMNSKTSNIIIICPFCLWSHGKTSRFASEMSKRVGDFQQSLQNTLPDHPAKYRNLVASTCKKNNHFEDVFELPSLKLTWHLKMDGWNTSFLLGNPIFRDELSVFGKGTLSFEVSLHISLPGSISIMFIHRPRLLHGGGNTHIGRPYNHLGLHRATSE